MKRLGEIAIVKSGYIHQLRAGDLIATPAYLAKRYPHLIHSSEMALFPFFATIFEPLIHQQYDALDNPEPEVFFETRFKQNISPEREKPPQLPGQSFSFTPEKGTPFNLAGKQDLFDSSLLTRVFFIRIKPKFRSEYIAEYIQLHLNKYIASTDHILGMMDESLADLDFGFIMNFCQIPASTLRQQVETLQSERDKNNIDSDLLPPWRAVADMHKNLDNLIECLSFDEVEFTDLSNLALGLVSSGMIGIPKTFVMPSYVTFLLKLTGALEAYFKGIYPLFLSEEALERYSKKPRTTADLMLDQLALYNNKHQVGQPMLAITPECLSAINKNAGDCTETFKADMYVNAHEAYDKFEEFLRRRCPFEQHELLELAQFRPLNKISYFELICVARLRRLIVDKHSLFEAARKCVENRHQEEQNKTPQHPSYYFHKKGTKWEVCFNSTVPFFLPDMKGAKYLDLLLHNPLDEFHVTALEEETSSDIPDKTTIGPQKVSDAQAIHEVRNKCKELIDDVEKFKQEGNLLAEQEAQSELEDLLKYMGKYDSLKSFSDRNEKLRQRIKNNLKNFYNKIDKCEERSAKEFLLHLKQSIREGYEIIYHPPKKIDWK